MKMTGAEILIKSIERHGTEYIFGLPGGTVIPLYDALYDSNLHHVLMRHEGTACHAAEGYARITGKAGVCLVTSGPGATNVITGMADAMLDSVPLVVIAGYVATQVIGTDAFQEADIFGSSLSFVKYSVLVRQTEEIPGIVERAFAIAESGRPGPVLLTMPVDVQRAESEFEVPVKPKVISHCMVPPPDGKSIDAALSIIVKSDKPVILAGGGTVRPTTSARLRDFALRCGIPVATTLMGKGAFPESDRLSLGMAGMHGTPQANLALSNCDLLIALGTRFSDRTTGNPAKFAPRAKVIHVDIDQSEFDKILKADVYICGDAGEVIDALSAGLVSYRVADGWLRQMDMWKSAYPISSAGDILDAPLIIERLREKAGGDCIVATEVGQNQMWAALHWKTERPGTFLTSGGLGTMGFGLPAAIGASFAVGRKPVVCISGDGSFLMNMQELETCSRYDVPVKVFLLDNGALGMVRQWQEMFAGEKYSSTITGKTCDFCSVAEACGVKSFKLDCAEKLDGVLDGVMEEPGPVLVDCTIPTYEKVLPMVPPGKGLDEFIL